MEKLYTFEDVKAYSVIALNNILHSANKDNIQLKTMLIFIEPLEDLYEAKFAVEYAKRLLEKEE